MVDSQREAALRLITPPPWWWTASGSCATVVAANPVPDPWWAAGLSLLVFNDRTNWCIMRGSRTRYPALDAGILPRTDPMTVSEPRPRPVVGRGTEPADVMTGPGTSNQRPLGSAGWGFVRPCGNRTHYLQRMLALCRLSYTDQTDLSLLPQTSAPLGVLVGTGSDHIMRTAWESNPLSPADAGALPIELCGCTIDVPLTRRTIACAQVSEAACGGNGRQSYKRGVVFSWSKLNSICEYIKLLG